jgi:hypothetical protein
LVQESKIPFFNIGSDYPHPTEKWMKEEQTAGGSLIVKESIFRKAGDLVSAAIYIEQSVG